MQTEYESLDGLNDTARRGLRNLLLACADTKLLLGYHYGEWTFGTPELEAAVASCSLSQSELGHLRLFQAVLKKHFDDDPDPLVERREPEAFANVAYLDRPIERWTGFVAMNAVVDLALTRMLHSLQGSAFRPLRMSIDKMLDEERYHIHHGRGWFRTLAGKEAEVRDRLQAHVGAALTSVETWFGPEGDQEDSALVEAGIKAQPNPVLFQAVVEDLRSLSTDLPVDPGAAAPASFDGWNPATRRAGTGGPDQQILFHLRGSKNELFKLG